MCIYIKLHTNVNTSICAQRHTTLSQNSSTSLMAQDTPNTGGGGGCIHLRWHHTTGRRDELGWREHTPQCSFFSPRCSPLPPKGYLHHQQLPGIIQPKDSSTEDHGDSVTADTWQMLADKSRSSNIICQFRPNYYHTLTGGWLVSFLLEIDIWGDTQKNQARQVLLKSVSGGSKLR